MSAFIRTYVFPWGHEPQITLSKKRTTYQYNPIQGQDIKPTYIYCPYITFLGRIFQDNMVLHMYIFEATKIHVFCIYKNIGMW